MTPVESITVSEEIEAPIWRVYQNWRRFERFPSFAPSVQEARWLSKSRLFWREEHLGKVHDCIYEIALDLPGSRLSWHSVSGDESSGTAVCEPQPAGRTRITLTVQFVPDDGWQAPAAVRVRHQAFLTGFKGAVEGGKSDSVQAPASAPKRKIA